MLHNITLCGMVRKSNATTRRTHKEERPMSQPGQKLIFVNLPVTDLDRSVAFYEAIGARKDARFSDATAAGMALSETIHVMLLTHDKYRQFTTKDRKSVV